VKYALLTVPVRTNLVPVSANYKAIREENVNIIPVVQEKLILVEWAVAFITLVVAQEQQLRQ